MSIRIMSAVWDQAPHKRERLLVLLALADFADDSGLCWPSLPTIAAKARITTQGAIGIIKTLEADGDIVVKRGGGRGKSNRYQLTRYAQSVNVADCFPADETVNGVAENSQPATENSKPLFTGTINRTTKSEPSHDEAVNTVLGISTGSDVEPSAREVYGQHWAHCARGDAEAFAKYVSDEVAGGADYHDLIGEWEQFVDEQKREGEWGKFTTSRNAVDRFIGWRAEGKAPGPLDLDDAW